MIKNFSHSCYTDDLPGGPAYLGEAFGYTRQEIEADARRRKLNGFTQVRVKISETETIIVK